MTIIKSLTSSEITYIRSCIAGLTDFWGPHEIPGQSMSLSGNTELSGKTIWLHYKDHGDWIQHDSENIKSIQDILDNLRIEISNNTRFGRTYIHRLDPGKIVGRHRDGSNLYRDPMYFDVVKRYQIYLDIPEQCEIESGSVIAENSVVLFDHKSWHSYTNSSDNDLIFIVFDLLEI